ncbi:MAG: TAXI family TRAP transporter solute-binding subunit, partial [Syntrophobacter sp.]
MRRSRIVTGGMMALALLLAVVLASSQAVAQTKNISISTGATSGTYYPLGTAIGKTLTEAGIVNATTESTGGSVENARLIGQKQTEIGFVESMIADWAYFGKEVYK